LLDTSQNNDVCISTKQKHTLVSDLLFLISSLTPIPWLGEASKPQKRRDGRMKIISILVQDSDLGAEYAG